VPLLSSSGGLSNDIIRLFPVATEDCPDVSYSVGFHYARCQSGVGHPVCGAVPPEQPGLKEELRPVRAKLRAARIIDGYSQQE